MDKLKSDMNGISEIHKAKEDLKVLKNAKS